LPEYTGGDGKGSRVPLLGGLTRILGAGVLPLHSHDDKAENTDKKNNWKKRSVLRL